MIETHLDTTKAQGHILMSPNVSLSWRGMKIYLWLISSLLFLIAMYFTYIGAWMVVPFAGLEILALNFLTVWVAYQCRRKQVIHVGDNWIRVEKGYQSPRYTWESELFWTRLVTHKSPYHGHLVKVFLHSKQRKLEIGEFLNEDDKKLLINTLRNVIRVD